MRNAYWASTHPAWTPDGYKCLCGLIYSDTQKLYWHVFTSHHTQKEAAQILSAKQWQRYCREHQLSPKEIEEALTTN